MGTRSQIQPLNIAVLVGTLNRVPQFRQFENHPSITSLDVKVRRDDKTTDVVRVSWFDAPTSALELEEGTQVAVLGRVRRYWSAGKQSHTDVVADTVVTHATPAKIRRAINGALMSMEDAVA